MTENVVAFIVARLSSSRLPKKQLKNIGDKRIIDWTIENVKKSKAVNKIVIATTYESNNMPLVDVAKEHNIDIFLYEGDINDVVGRLNRAAIKYNASIPILISGDCPLIWAKSLDKLIEKALSDKDIDAVSFSKKDSRDVIHEGMCVYRKKCWELADKISDKPNLREHQFPIIGLMPDMFKIAYVVDDDIFYKIKHRMSVDTLADLKFMNVVYNKLKEQNEEFNMQNVVELLSEKPELMDINRDVHQITIDEKQRKALFVLKNRENLDTFFNMAYELTKNGVGVRFFTENEDIVKAIDEKGFGIIDKIDKNGFNFVIEDSGKL